MYKPVSDKKIAKKPDFSTFYRRHCDAVYRFVYFRVKGQKEVAEDLVSAIFMSALEAYDRFDPSLGEKSWIMTIARNRVINHWRDAKEHADIDDLAFSLEGSNGFDDAIASQEKSTLAEAMSHLAISERDILEKKYLLGYSYEEIAKENNRSAGSVRIEAFRALRKLRTILKKKV